MATRDPVAEQARSTIVVVLPDPAEATMMRLPDGILDIFGHDPRFGAIKDIQGAIGFVVEHIPQELLVCRKSLAEQLVEFIPAVKL